MILLSDTFELTRVINLPDRRDRYRAIVRQVAELGMAFRPGKVELYAATRPAERGGFDGLGVCGCFLSHLEVLRDARDRGVESVLVMEDDCEVSPQNTEAIGKIAADVRKAAWGFCYLGHRVPAPKAVVPGLTEFAGPVQTTHLYAVQRDTLPALVDYLESCLTRPGGHPAGGPMPVDGALTMFRAAHLQVLTLLAQPSMAKQRSSRSDITFRSIESVPGFRQAFSVARVVRRALANPES